MKKCFLFFAIAATISIIGCSKGEENGVRVNPQDKGFVHDATLANLAEIVLGQLAADSSQDPEIKAFGQNMVSMHSASAGELEGIASNLGINTPDTLRARHEQLRQLLLTKKGREFDSLYIHSQVEDHRNTVNLYGNAHGLGNTLVIENFIIKHMPAVIQHFQEAESIAQEY